METVKRLYYQDLVRVELERGNIELLHLEERLGTAPLARGRRPLTESTLFCKVLSSREEVRAPVPTDPDAPSDLFIGFQEQLGMKLEAKKAPTVIVVIEKVSKPSEN